MSLRHFWVGGGAGAAADTKGTSRKEEDENSQLDVELRLRTEQEQGSPVWEFYLLSSFRYPSERSRSGWPDWYAGSGGDRILYS